MAYPMVFKVDGACRGNGRAGARGAAAVVQTRGSGAGESRTDALPNPPTPTNQRAELTAVIMALEMALDIYQDLSGNPYLNVTIKSDSTYAVRCMDTWGYGWAANGWVNAAGNRVANRDLVQHALYLQDELKNVGPIHYTWISREQNRLADRLCNEALDKML